MFCLGLRLPTSKMLDLILAEFGRWLLRRVPLSIVRDIAAISSKSGCSIFVFVIRALLRATPKNYLQGFVNIILPFLEPQDFAAFGMGKDIADRHSQQRCSPCSSGAIIRR